MAIQGVDRSYRALLGVPTLTRILVGSGIARIAGGAMLLAIILFTLERYDSPALAGAVSFALMFPGLVTSPIAGALLDRHGRMRLIALDYAVLCVSLLAIAGLALTDRLSGELLIAIAALSSFTQPLSSSGIRSLFPVIVPEPLWERANAIESNLGVASMLLGPPAAAMLIQVGGGPLALAALGVVFGLAALSFVGLPEPRVVAEPQGNLLADARAGLMYVVRFPTLRMLAIGAALVNFSFGILDIGVPVLVDRLHGDAAVVGAVWAVLGAAGILPSLLVGRMDLAGRERAVIAWSTLGAGLGLTALLLPAGLPIVFASALVVGALEGPGDVALMTLRQRVTDPAWMGRALTVSMSLNFVGAPIGSLLGGWLIERSLDGALALAAGGTLVAGIAFLVGLPARATAAAGHGAERTGRGVATSTQGGGTALEGAEERPGG